MDGQPKYKSVPELLDACQLEPLQYEGAQQFVEGCVPIIARTEKWTVYSFLDDGRPDVRWSGARFYYSPAFSDEAYIAWGMFSRN